MLIDPPTPEEAQAAKRREAAEKASLKRTQRQAGKKAAATRKLNMAKRLLKEAEETLRQVMERYPKTKAAREAKALLEK